jgi:hypothetical protein
LKPDWEESFFSLLASFVVVVGIHHFLCLDLKKLKRNTANYNDKEKKFNQLQRKKGRKENTIKNREVKKSNQPLCNLEKTDCLDRSKLFFLMDCYKKTKVSVFKFSRLAR